MWCTCGAETRTATCHAPLGIDSVSTWSRESSFFSVFNTNPSQIAVFQNNCSLNHNFGKERERERFVYALSLPIPHRNDMEKAPHHLRRCTSRYVARTAGFRQTLFNRERSRGKPLTKQRWAQWLSAAMPQGYIRAGTIQSHDACVDFILSIYFCLCELVCVSFFGLSTSSFTINATDNVTHTLVVKMP